MKSATFVLILVFLFTPFILTAQWQRLGGPEGGTVSALHASGGVVFSGTEAGAFRSTDDGLTWNPSLTGRPPSGISYMGSHAGVVFAGGGGSILMKTSDGGVNWVECSSGNGSVVIGLIDRGSALFSASAWQGIYRTTDQGQTWEERNNGLSSLRSRVFVGTAATMLYSLIGGGVYLSTDDGANWENIDAALPGNDLRKACVHNDAYFAYIYANGIYRSTDEGQSWNATGLTSGTFNHLYSDGTRLYAIESSQLSYSDDNGDSWTTVSLLAETGAGRCVVKAGSRLFVGHGGTGITASTDDGVTWMRSSSGHAAARIRDVYGDGQTIFASVVDGGLHRSTNAGADWTKLDIASLAQSTRAIVERGNTLFCGTNDGILASSDNGDTWNRITSEDYSISCLSADSPVMYAGTYNGEALASTDDGVTWTMLGDIGVSNNINGIIDNGSVIMASTMSKGIFVSTDGGVTWEARNNGLGSSPASQCLAYLNGVWYSGANPGLYSSSDDGLTWIPRSNQVRQSSAYSMSVAGDGIVVGTYSLGVYYFDPADTLWTKISDGYDGTGVLALGVSDGNVLLGSYGDGLWTRPLSELTPSPALTVDTGTMDFGSVTVGLTKPENVEISNEGNWTARVYSCFIEGADASAFTLTGWDKEVFLTGEADVLTVEFAPDVERAYTATLVITTGDPAMPTKSISLKGNAVTTSVDHPPATAATVLLQNHPNPASGLTHIPIVLQRSGHLRLELFDLLGRPVRLLRDAEMSAGSYSIPLDVATLPPGVYIYRLHAGSDVISRRLVIETR